MDANTVLVGLTAALVAVTGFYAWVTFRIMGANERVVAAMQQQAEAEGRPYLTVNVFSIPKGVVFYLRIANTGRTAANDVRLTLDRDFYQYGQKSHPSLRSATAFQQPIEQLPPGSELVFGLAQGFVVLGKDADPAITPPVFTITATYSYGSKTVTERTTIDLRPYGESMDPPSAVVDELERIRKEIEKLGKKLGA
jgi:hypothetical protein